MELARKENPGKEGARGTGRHQRWGKRKGPSNYVCYSSLAAAHTAQGVAILARGHLLSFKKYFSYFINSRHMIIPVSIWW